VLRLQKCLRGRAEEAVFMLLLVADHDQEIIEILEQNFGKTDFIIQDLMAKAKNYPPVKTWGEFLKFGNMVRNLTVTLERLEDFGEKIGTIPNGALWRVIKCYPGNDGLVRVVDVQTNYGLFRRAVTKLGRTNAEIHVETEVQHWGEDVTTQAANDNQL
jgi:hypothetical protein